MTNLQQILKQLDTQDKCMALLVNLRWPDGARCPRCGTDKVFQIKHRAWNWVCKSGAETIDKQTGEIKICKKQGYRFSPLVGTVFENTNYPLPVWFEVIYLICQSKKGMSAMQVQRMLTDNGRKTAYKTAFYICHRVRAMLDNPEFGPLIGQLKLMKHTSAAKTETAIGTRSKEEPAQRARFQWSARSPAKVMSSAR